MALELNTYGDLKKVIRAIALKQKGEKIGDIALGTLIGFIPGAEAAKTTFDFVRAIFSDPPKPFELNKWGTLTYGLFVSYIITYLIY